MATQALLGGIAVIAALCCGVFAYRAGTSWLRRQKMRTGAVSPKKAGGFSLLSSGFSPLLPLARKLCGMPRIAAAARKVQRFLCTAQEEPKAPVEIFLSGALAICLLAFAIVGLVFQSALLGALAGGGLAAVVIARASSSSRKDAETLRDHIPDALLSMNRCYQASMTTQQTFDQLAAGEHGPLRPLFQQCANSLRTGEPLGEALKPLREREDIPELVFLSAALEIQHQTGGTMKPVLDAVTQTIRTKIDLARKLKAQTAQAQLSAKVVGAMPFILLAVLSLISRDFLAPFFESTAGFAVLILALLLQVSGILIIRGLLKASV